MIEAIKARLKLKLKQKLKVSMNIENTQLFKMPGCFKGYGQVKLGLPMVGVCLVADAADGGHERKCFVDQNLWVCIRRMCKYA